MTQKEQLWENYEDAVFAILMDAVAEQEGEKGLQLMEELEHDPSAQVPEEVQRRAEKTIRKAFAAKNYAAHRNCGICCCSSGSRDFRRVPRSTGQSV